MSRWPCMIDFEASGLGPDSYPIEVAWSDPSGSVESHYITPARGWDAWDPDAEAVHRIPRHLLLDCGKPAHWVAQRMNAALAGQTVYADVPEMDAFWLQTLFDVPGMDPAFTLGSFWDIHPDPTGRLPWAVRTRILDTAETERGGRQHEAGSDVRFLLAVYRLSREAMKAHGHE